MTVRLSASMACANPLSYREIIAQLEEGKIDSYHFDMCDGHFAPTFLLAPGLLRSLRLLTRRRFDVHLYCTHPSRYLDELVAAGADVVVVHVEAAEDFAAVVRQIRAAGLRAGIAVLPGSPLPRNIAGILPVLSVAVTNMVGPAYAGQAFDARGLENARALSSLARRLNPGLEIAADGHVSSETLELLAQAGCNHLVCGTSSLFKPGINLYEALELFRSEVEAVWSRRRSVDSSTG